MKVFLFSLFSFVYFFSKAESISLVDIPHHIFVNQGRTNFHAIFNDAQVEKLVFELYQQQILFHDYTQEVNPNSNFETYWSVFKDKWKNVDLDNDGILELILQGKTSAFDEKEYIEIYKKSNEGWTKIHGEVGRLLAYKIHPNTKKIILYQHRYPCCFSASHNIITVRMLRGKINTTSRFFVGRDHDDMVGPFYPDSVNYTSSFKQLDKKSLLRWSPNVVEKNAFINFSETNAIIHYEKGAYYKLLFTKDEWSFVLMYSGIVNEQAIVVNAANFVSTPIYGWINTAVER